MDVELQNALNSLTHESKKIFTDLVEKNAAVEKQVTDMQRQLDAVDARGQDRLSGGVQTKSMLDRLKEDDSFQRLLRDKKGTAILTLEGSDAQNFMERKATITATGSGFQSTGVFQIDRDQGITAEARETLTIRSVLSARPTSAGYIDYVRVSNPMSVSSPMMQIEANLKPEQSLSFTSASEKVRTIATWQPCSRQALDDMQELAAFIDGTLRYYLDLEEELQIIAGAGTGEDLTGLVGVSTAFNTALLGSSWTKIDLVARAIQQLAIAKELDPTFLVCHPTDWWNIRLAKDGDDNFMLGSPLLDVRPRLFSLRVIPTTSISAGTFLLGSGNPAAVEIRDRLTTQIEVSTSHSDFFSRNLLAVRGDKRLALVTKRPGSILHGSFTQSPA